ILKVALPTEGLRTMATCDTCGNDYDKPLTVTQGGRTGTFDSFECAVHAMARSCDFCGCRILGHGVEAQERMFCCAHCARAAGEVGIADRT
ncbi:MAG TPA: hypothetical protein VK060_08630, partial [Ruania sp.]|nr:hypothetical protein [Ruania sp.]